MDNKLLIMIMVGGVTAFLILLVVRAVWNASEQAEQKREEDYAEAFNQHAEAMRKAGHADDQGNPLCIVCGGVATRPFPMIGPSKFDQMPSVRWLSELYGVPWKYTVTTAPDGESERLCAEHHHQGVELLRGIAAELRAQHSKFNQEQKERCLIVNRGELLRKLRGAEDHIRAVFKESLTPPAERQLQAPKVKS